MHDRGSAQTLHQCIRITRPALHFAAEYNQKGLQLQGKRAAVYRRIKGPSKGSPTEQQGMACMDAELQWDAAILTVMVDGGAQDADDAGSRALQSMVSAWQEAPVAGTLSQKVGSSAQGLHNGCCSLLGTHLFWHSAAEIVAVFHYYKSGLMLLLNIWLQPCMTFVLYGQVVAGIIQRARDAAGAALSDRSADSSGSALDSRIGVLSGLSSLLRGQGAGVQPTQQHE